MLFATVGQGAIFMWMLSAGAAVGALYMLLRAVRRATGAGFWLAMVCDLIFGAGAAAILICALIAADYGRVRIYHLIAALLGAAMSLWALELMADRARDLARRAARGIAHNRIIKVIFK